MHCGVVKIYGHYGVAMGLSRVGPQLLSLKKKKFGFGIEILKPSKNLSRINRNSYLKALLSTPPNQWAEKLMLFMFAHPFSDKTVVDLCMF